MKRTFFVLIGLLLSTSIVLAQPVAQKNKVKELIAKKKGINANQVEKELEKGAVDKGIQSEIDEVIERIRRQKVDEARNYDPTDAEIIAKLQAKIDAQE